MKLNISGANYTIHNETEIEDWGMVSHIHKQIYRKKQDQPDFDNMVLMHESIHAISFLGGLELSEDQVMALGNSMIYFIQNNPQFIKDILERKCHGSKCKGSTTDLSRLSESKS